MNVCQTALIRSGDVKKMRHAPRCGIQMGVAVGHCRQKTSHILLSEKLEPLPPRQQSWKLGFNTIKITD